MKARRIGIAIGITLSLVVAGVAPAGGAAKYSRVTVRMPPGHVCAKTRAVGLRNDGTMLGTAACGHTKVFLRSKSGDVSFYRLPPKDGANTLAVSLASDGTFAVLARHGFSRYTSYLVSADGHPTKLKDPKATDPRGTQVTGLNKHGVAVGYFYRKKRPFTRSFIYRHGKFHTFKVHMPHGRDPRLWAISDTGRLAGNYYDKQDGTSHGFVVSHGHVRVVDAPTAGHKSGRGTWIFGIANNGSVCGQVVRQHGRYRGFVEINHKMHLIHPPGVKHGYIEVNAVNNHGEVAGAAAYGHQFTGFIGQFG